MKFRTFPPLLFLALPMACVHKKTGPEYVKEVKSKAEYVQEVSQGGGIVKCQYLPNTYLALMETQSVEGPQNKKAVFEEARNKFSMSSYFSLTLEMEDGSNVLLKGVRDRGDYASRLNFISSGMDQCFFAIRENGDTVRSNLYEYQRSYGNSPNATMLFAFPRSETVDNGESKLEFHYRDRLLGIRQVKRLVFANRELREDKVDITF
jgi:hypothetical protein